MRYFLVSYVKKPNGQIDEAVSLTKSLKLSDNQNNNVILDFKEKKVVQCFVDGARVETDWERLFSYYSQHYPNIIERLVRESSQL